MTSASSGRLIIVETEVPRALAAPDDERACERGPERIFTGGAAEELDTRELWRVHGPYLWRVLRYLGVHEADLPDACQDLLLVVHRRAGSFERRSSVRTWLHGICIRIASHHRRRVRRRREEPLSAFSDAISENSEQWARQVEARRSLLWLLDELDHQRRTVFVLHEIEQLTMDEVARLLKIPVGTGFTRLRAARRDLDRAISRLRAAGELP